MSVEDSVLLTLILGCNQWCAGWCFTASFRHWWEDVRGPRGLLGVSRAYTPHPGHWIWVGRVLTFPPPFCRPVLDSKVCDLLLHSWNIFCWDSGAGFHYGSVCKSAVQSFPMEYDVQQPSAAGALGQGHREGELGGLRTWDGQAHQVGRSHTWDASPLWKDRWMAF